MDIDQARVILARFIDVDHLGKESIPGLVVRSTARGFVYEAPGGLTADEAEAIAVWLREALK
jgi:hypothetical protein